MVSNTQGQWKMVFIIILSDLRNAFDLIVTVNYLFSSLNVFSFYTNTFVCGYKSPSYTDKIASIAVLYCFDIQQNFP